MAELSDHIYAYNNAYLNDSKSPLIVSGQEQGDEFSPYELFKPPPPGQKQMSRIYKGYAYTINCKTATRTYLCCLKRKAGQYNCKGRLLLMNGEIIETGHHNHPPDENLVKKKKFNDMLRLAAKENVGSFREIYAKYAKEYPEAVKGTSFSSLARKYRRWVNQENSIENTNDFQKVPLLSEIRDVEHFLSELNKTSNCFFYGASNLDKKLLHHRVIESFHHKNRHLLLYDKEIMDKICDARRIIVHKTINKFSKKSDLSVINIIFEKYEKALAGFWLLMKGNEEQCYVEIFEFLKYLFPYFDPKEAIVDYDRNMQSGLKVVFPNLIIFPSFLNQIQIIFECAIRHKTAKSMNRIVNPEKHAELLKFMALPLLPKDTILTNYQRLVSDCRIKYQSFFDLFIEDYNKEWIEGWKPEIFSVYRQKYLMKDFLECYRYRQNFKSGKKLQPSIFLEKIKDTLITVRKDLEFLEHGEVLSYYLTTVDEEKEKKLYKTWDRLDGDLITVNECLMICSNLLNEDFIDSLPISDRRSKHNEHDEINDDFSDNILNDALEVPQMDLLLELDQFQINGLETEIISDFIN